MYSLFLDDGVNMTGRSMRFACGILVDKKGADMKQTLLDMNPEIRELQEENTDEDPPALTVWKLTSYEEVSLPSVDAAVVQFPSTNGIVSSLVLQYRVSEPALTQLLCGLLESMLIHCCCCFLADYSSSSEICQRKGRG